MAKLFEQRSQAQERLMMVQRHITFDRGHTGRQRVTYTHQHQQRTGCCLYLWKSGYFRVKWLLLHIMFTCSGHHYRQSVDTGVWRPHLHRLSLPWLDNQCVSLLFGVKTTIWQPYIYTSNLPSRGVKHTHTHTHAGMFQSLPQERVRVGVWKLHIPSRIRIISQSLLTLYF